MTAVNLASTLLLPNTSAQELPTTSMSKDFQLPDTQTTLDDHLIQTFVASGANPTDARSAADLFLESIMMMMIHMIQHSAEKAHETSKQNRLLNDI